MAALVSPAPVAVSVRGPIPALREILVFEVAGQSYGLPSADVLELVLVDEACIQPPETLGPKATYVAGVARLAEGMVLIHDLTTFLSASEAASLDEALPAPVTR